MRATAGDLPYFRGRFVALAHRGGVSADAPAEVENSLRAFEAAWRLGFTHLETDVHTTADGVLIAFHDTELDRVTDAAGAVADLPWAEVSRARIGGSEPVPTLDDLLDALPHARFNIDLKAPGAVEPLVAALDRHGAHDRVCVGSFGERTIRRFRRLTAGRVPTSASPVEMAVFGLLRGVRRVFPLAGRVFQMPERHEETGLLLLSPRMVAAAHARGAQVHIWTVNDRTDMERLIDLGVDGIVSDDLETLRGVLIDRDLWEGNA